MKKSLNIVTPVFLLLFLLLGCNDKNDFDCLKSTGSNKSEERQLAPFAKINLQDNINLIFVPGPTQKVVVEGGRNLLPKVITKVTGDSLVIENRNYCNWVRSYDREVKVFIHGNPGIDLYNYGYGKVSGTVKGDYFFIKSWSNENMDLHVDLDYFWLETLKMGNTTLSGSIKKFMGFRHETGRFDMRNVGSCKDLLYHDHGQGLSYLKADSSAVIRIFDSGSVEVYGEPEVRTVEQMNGTGEVFFK